ncbi:DUF1102 domain-containing protein [Halorubrum xinjiangense]|uniref:DUF1102 domain-containing protein n=1 Tax=Halorubrum xinjiangense TaxID=261291 RepID=UPI00122D857C|nr:DUF1102 domain-containing protein [Halorubrum xinjiangense]
MANRRKFIAGLGALATGSAAAVGTGALETSASERTVNVNVAADSSGFVEIAAENSTYASGTSDGQLELDFNSDSGLGVIAGDAQGLNPDSTFTFEEVFSVRNGAGQGDLYVVIEATGFELENIELTAEGSEADDISGGTSLRAEDYSDTANVPKLVQPDKVDVDMTIETKDDGTTGNVGGTLTIHAATGGNQAKLSDVLGSDS